MELVVHIPPEVLLALVPAGLAALAKGIADLLEHPPAKRSRKSTRRGGARRRRKTGKRTRKRK